MNLKSSTNNTYLTKLRNDIWLWLIDRGVFAWRYRIYKKNFLAADHPEARGMPDIMGVLRDGRFLAIEVELPGKRVGLLKRKFLEDVDWRGGVSMVVTSFEEAKELLKGYVR